MSGWRKKQIMMTQPKEPEQEPVAHTLNCVCGAVWDIKADGSEEMAHTPDTTPPQRTWVNATTWRGLTKKEVHDLFHPDFEIFHQRIEAKLKKKNGYA